MMPASSPRNLQNVCAVVVTFFPDEGVVDRLSAVHDQAGHLIVVDNGSNAQALAVLEAWRAGKPNVELLVLGRNTGLAAALNRGLAKAEELGFELAITFDQDSTPASGMVAELLRTLANYPESRRVAVVGPTIVDRNAPVECYRWLRPNPVFPALFQRVSCEDVYREDVTFVITSGALMPLAAYRELGPLQEDLFIDYVDHEYCLRARARGYRVLVAGRARLLHALGAKRVMRVGRYSVRPTFHAADRLYYIYRNRIPLLKRYGLREFHWLAFDLLATGHNLFRVAFFEDDRWRKLSSVLEGTVDGLLGRTGARPSRRRRT
jgi:rhamnosyltransferase